MEFFLCQQERCTFCAIGVDHAMDQENKRIKVKGGGTGLTHSQAPFGRFILTSPLMTHLFKLCQDQTGCTKQKSSTKSYQLTGSVNKRINENIQNLISKMDEFNL